MDIRVGQILTMKKPHPCGSARWEVLRIGADFRLRCLGCGHEVMGARSKFEKRIKAVEPGSASPPPGNSEFRIPHSEFPFPDT